MNKRTGSSKKLKRARPALGIALAVGAAAAVATTAHAAVVPGSADPVEAPPFAVEDFEYPGAEQILEDRGIQLKRGDGHIVLADCSDDNVIQVASMKSLDDACFRVTGDSGFLTLELSEVYLIQTNDYSLTEIAMTVGDETVHYELGPNDKAPVGASEDEQERPHTLVRIQASR